MKKKSLMYKSLTQFIVCVAILLLLATPLFYWLTKSFYAEDIIDIIEAVQQGKPVPALDLEEDILHGIMIQFALIVTVLGVAIVLTMRFISGRLWQPFDKTLEAIEHFKLENGVCPQLAESDTKEFVRLNIALQRLMTDSLHSYRLQKEFTENASHELQTPLAVFQSKLDLLLQQPELTERQAAIIQDLYQMNSRLSRLNRNLLLLAKMENNQFSRTESVDVITVIKDLQPYLESLSGGLILKQNFSTASLPIKANRSLLESMVNNLVVNAVRHNKTSGEITVSLSDNRLMVSNTSDDAALDADQIFNRFYRPSEKTTGNGLGLAIVKAVCDYHGWKILYAYADGKHQFVVIFR
ncbi:sensor histidine kinase [Bacteroides sp. AM23-18]|jgi:two-component system, OmpR family, sensor kinase|nr:sensor histidine kinase [Bacteroides sp. AM23-18]